MARAGGFRSASKGTSRFDSEGERANTIATEYGARVRSRQMSKRISDYEFAAQTRLSGMENAAKAKADRLQQRDEAQAQKAQGIADQQAARDAAVHRYEALDKQLTKGTSANATAYRQAVRERDQLALRIKGMNRSLEEQSAGFGKQEENLRRDSDRYKAQAGSLQVRADEENVRLRNMRNRARMYQQNPW